MDNLKKYVKTVISAGINIQPGQKLFVSCPVECAEFGRLAMEEAYKMGAARVHIDWYDQYAKRINYLLAPDTNFGVEYEWLQKYFDHLTEDDYRCIFVDSFDPEIYKDVDPQRIEKNIKVANKREKQFQQKLDRNEVQWCVVSVPGEGWAKKVFPNATNPIETMWEEIFKATRINEDFDSHLQNLKSIANKLNDYNFKTLHFTNDLGTDLTVDLPPGHIWLSCGEETDTGDVFIANIPTEEVFTVPHRTGVNGIVYNTKPLVYMGNIIDGFSLTFKDGMVVESSVKKSGEKFLNSLLTLEKNTNYLGEVALVPYNSPISRSGVLWYNTLFDENAACHLALGGSYPVCHKEYKGKTENELEAMGLNQCPEHEDFMISDETTRVEGITQTGEKVTIMENGDYVI
ncbi:MAG: aminopeptidase [Defluviitaleaceae bacterium]|nr:aminopeptidase [Defluviitaleaceae bacterium]